MRVEGTVRSVDVDHALVDVGIARGCGRCHEPGGCGGVNIASPMMAATRSLRIRNTIGARPGETVDVVIEEGLPLNAALRVYGLPLAGILLGAALGVAVTSSGNGDLLAALGALSGGVCGALVGRRMKGLPGRGTPPLRLERAVGGVGSCTR